MLGSAAPHLQQATSAETRTIHLRAASWCSDRHTETQQARVDVCCLTSSPGIRLPMRFDGEDEIGGEALFTFTAVEPFCSDPGRRVPHVCLQVADGVWLSPLAPHELSNVIYQLRTRLDELERQVLPQLTVALAEW
ncbi:DUF6907 domain-containing protein [Streptomyces olivaceus]|uniref:DUF6907 domain-containing protein n=1 Tax=Streptomyces olivaceus TaxID=47716 RepID=UPI003F69615C